MKALPLAICLIALLALAGCGDDDSGGEPAGGGETTTATTGPESTEPAGEAGKPSVEVPAGPPPKRLRSEELREGSGPRAEAGDEVTVHYVGVGYESGEQFDASWDRREPFSFVLGTGQVIPGWEQGVEGMRAGGRRELRIPARLAYGEQGSPPAIGPNEALIFVVDLLEIG